MEAVNLDLTDAKALLAASRSDRNRQLLVEHITALEKVKTGIEAATAKAAASSAAAAATAASAPAAAADAAPAAAAAKAPAPALAWGALSSYYWDQTNDVVKVVIRCEGVGEAKDRIETDFQRNSFQVRVLNFKGKNWRLTIPHLSKDIVPGESKAVAKKNKLYLLLKKVPGTYGPDHWMELVDKNPEKTAKATKDPTAGLMDMMKKMYDEGDDQTKKIIGESMMKAQKKQMNPGFKDDDDDAGFGGMPKMPSF